MIWLISGSREFPDEKLARVVMRNQFKEKDIVIHGCARGTDTWADEEATRKNIRVIKYPADWNKGKGAGLQRNKEMLDNAIHLQTFERERVLRALIFWDGVSHGTQHMLELCTEFGLPVTLIQANYD